MCCASLNELLVPIQPLSERLLALQEVDAFQTNSNEWLDNEDNTCKSLELKALLQSCMLR